MNKFLIVLFAVYLTGCTSQADAERALKAEGYKNIEITGYAFFDCSKDDTYHTGFRAKNREGKTVEGTVCSGLLFKNATIRY